jgi:predicted DNA-binding transcriptional regulator AlpA
MHTPTQIKTRCLRTNEAASYTSLSKSTLEKLRVTGGGPVYAALGRVVVYRLEDLDSWVSAHIRCSTSDNTP